MDDRLGNDVPKRCVRLAEASKILQLVMSEIRDICGFSSVN